MTHPRVEPSPQQTPAEEQGEPQGKVLEPASEEQTALDLLEDEDRTVLELLSLVEEARAGARDDVGADRVHRRVEYGNRAKLLVRHVATREAAATAVSEGIRGLDGVGAVADRLGSQAEERRVQLNRVEEMSRGVQGMNLNTAQDFDRQLAALVALVRPEAEWELAEGVPTLRRQLGPEGCSRRFPSAKHVARHAPTHRPSGLSGWYERVPGLSRAVAAAHHLRDFSRSTRDART